MEIRKFNFSAYPDYVKNLREYRWKAIVIAETLRDYGAVWYLDSSLIITKSNLSHVEALLKCQKSKKLESLAHSPRFFSFQTAHAIRLPTRFPRSHGSFNRWMGQGGLGDEP